MAAAALSAIVSTAYKNLGVDRASTRVFSSEQVQGSFDRWMAPLHEKPAFNFAAKQPGGAARLKVNGMRRINERDLETHARVMLKLMEVGSLELCDYLVRGTSMGDRQVQLQHLESGLNALGPDEVDQWFRINARAIEIGLDPSSSVLPLPEQGNLADAWLSASGRLSKLDIEQAERLFDSPNEMSGTEACNAGKIVFRTALDAPKPHSLILLRQLSIGS